MLFIASPAFALVIGDIDFSKVDYNNPVYRGIEGDSLIRIHSYPDEAIQVVHVFGRMNAFFQFGILEIQYLKNGHLCVWRWDSESQGYKMVSAFPDQAEVDRIKAKIIKSLDLLNK